jgi:hypothetical protein
MERSAQRRAGFGFPSGFPGCALPHWILIREWSWLRLLLLLIAVELTVYGSWSALKFGSWRIGLEYLRGDSLVVHDRTLALGRIPVGAEALGRIDVSNVAARTVTIKEVRATGNRMVVERFPLAIDPKQTKRLSVIVRAEKQGDLKEDILVLSDAEHQQVLSVTAKATVVPRGTGK